ncbi:syntaxin-12-like isoform X1 [Dreissena polymorpha]|uniref:syntaxin-12-like isoform X1 n=1 Tax=Dreissena polymorpha TaxID=45954 RepID=UPI0022642C26|nr:syntaxin-12-like isoform X1 [Dreissena polymorpha]
MSGMASYGRGNTALYQGGSASGSKDPTALAAEIGRNIGEISRNVIQLEKLVKQIGTPQDSEQVRDRVHKITHDTNKLAQDINKDMKTLANLPVPENQQRQMKLQKERLTEEFSDTLNKFQTVQRSAAVKEKESISRARAASSGFKTKDVPLIDFSSEFRDEPKEQFSQQGYSQTAQIMKMENDVDLESLRERESAIKQLESDIMDVNQIFKDLGMLVHQQGEQLDSIEANVENAVVHVEKGGEELKQAVTYQSKARRKKCCLIIVILVVLAVVAIIIAVAVPKK